MAARKNGILWVVALAATVQSLHSESAFGQAPPPPPESFTFWKFLGIPQAINKVKDASINTRGNRPGMERKPPIKRLADPANLESKNPAIKAAAQIKAEEDLAQQKIKALKYLATIGCGCYDKKIDPPVKVALMAALDDCTEQVRYEAAKAIAEAACSKCKHCSQNCCCDKAMTDKLSAVAFEKDDNGCWLESSARVRAAAKEAMRACCRGNQPPPGFIPTEVFNELNLGVPNTNGPVETVPSIKTPETAPNSSTIPVLPVPPQPNPAPVSPSPNSPQGVPAVPTPPAPVKTTQIELPSQAAELSVSFAEQVEQPMRAESTSVVRGSDVLNGVPARNASFERKSSTPEWISDEGDKGVPAPAPIAADPFEAQDFSAPIAPTHEGVLRGKITSVNTARRQAHLAFPNSDTPWVGARVQVTHEFVLGKESLGWLQIVSVNGRNAVAVPLANADFAHMERADGVFCKYDVAQRNAREAVESVAEQPTAEAAVRQASHRLGTPE
jgi:hypothetical protein